MSNYEVICILVSVLHNFIACEKRVDLLLFDSVACPKHSYQKNLFGTNHMT